MKNFALYTPFTKVEAQSDGTAIVYGTVTDETVDTDGQITDLDWFRKASKGWEQWSNVREMHQASAVGVGIQLEDTGDAILLSSHIIDPVAARKCIEQVYKGYSWGGRSVPGNPVRVVKDAVAPNGRIVSGELVEISVVDRPANPNSVFTLVKNDKALALAEESESLVKALAVTVVKGEPDPELQAAFQLLEDYEIDDAQLMLVTANLVRYIMLRRLHEQAEPDDLLTYFLSDFGSMYDTLLSYSHDEAGESWADMASRIISGLATSHTVEEIIADASAGVEGEGEARAASENGELLRNKAIEAPVQLKIALATLTKDFCIICSHDLPCACKDCMGDMHKTMEVEDTMDKTQLAELIKGMTVEERTEIGFGIPEGYVKREDLDAVKAELAEIGKRTMPGGPSLRGAIPVQAASSELPGLVAEKSQLAEIIKMSTDLDVRRYTQLRLQSVDAKIAELTPQE